MSKDFFDEMLDEILEKHKLWLEGNKDGERANLNGASLIDANLTGVNLSGADLVGANLCGANLSEANLIKTNLSNVSYDGATSYFAIQCPEEGSFIGYKKSRDNKIVKILITEDSKRSSATTRKCRCSKAKVLSITNLDGTNSKLTEVCSNFDENFIYRVGETIKVSNFDEDRWNECSTGIHFFITRDEAVNY